MKTTISKVIGGKRYTMNTNKPLNEAMKRFKAWIHTRYELTCAEYNLNTKKGR